MKRKFIGIVFAAVFSAIAFTGCGGDKESGQASGEGKTIVIGATEDPHKKILDLIVDDMAELGYTLDVQGYADWQILNTAVAEKEIDANFFQHLPYLEKYVADSGNKLVSMGYVHLEPMGLYSEKHDSLEALPEGAGISVPDDGTNRGRALKMLAENGLIELDPDAGDEAGIEDITGNTKNFKIEALDAAMIPRALGDVDLAVINGNYALNFGLDPNKDSIALESAENNPYANVVAVREEDKDNPEYKALMDLLHSDEVTSFINDNYNGAVIPAK